MTETIPWPTDQQLAEDEAVQQQELAAIKFNEAVAVKAREIKIYNAAHARVQADKFAHIDYGEQYLDRAGLLNLPTPEPLIKGILPRHAYGLLRGRDGTLKSFVALDWSLCLATGKSWQGHPVEPTRVLYIAGEGAHGLGARVDAWEFGWGRNVEPGMFSIRKTALNLHQPGPAFDHLLDFIHTGGYGFVVVDTLRRVSGSADGNSSEMGLVIDNLDRIKQATHDGTVLAVAHTDKGDHDTRGYSGIEDDADFVWSAKREEMFLALELTKMKDGPDGRTIHLEALPVLHSLTLSGLTGTPTPNTTESQRKILDTLRDLAIDGMAPTALLKASGLAESTFYRAIKELHQAGHIQNLGTPTRKNWVIPALEDDSHDLSPDETASDLDVSHNSHDSQSTLPLLPPTPTTLGVGVMRESETDHDSNGDTT